MKISVVSPVYKSEKIVLELVRQLTEVLSRTGFEYEIILVDDRSPDMAWEQIKICASQNKHLKGVRLSRNFGQHYAITAGLAQASGDFVVVMDCDLQDDPADIPRLIEMAMSGHDVVLTKRNSRAHSFFKNIASLLYFKLLNTFTDGAHGTDKVGNFSVLSAKAVKSFLAIGDIHRHYLMIVRMLGYSTAYLDVTHRARYEGKTSYSFWRLVKHGIDGVVSQSLKLLYASIFMGLLFFILSMAGAAYYIVNYFIHKVVPGYTSLVVLILLSTGIILMSMGVLGVYVGKIFDQVRNRPLYFIDEKINF